VHNCVHAGSDQQKAKVAEYMCTTALITDGVMGSSVDLMLVAALCRRN
jgi:hypothetical protein